MQKKPGTNPRPLSYISPLRALAVLMRIPLAPHNETRQRGLKSKRSHACSAEFVDTLTCEGKLDSLKPLCSICLNCLFNFENFVQQANCKFRCFGYNNINRTPRTSPRQRVMCPRGDIFIFGGISIGIKTSYYL